MSAEIVKRENRIVLGVGRKGSGKSSLLRTRYVPQFPRVITLDLTGEARESYPEAIEAIGLKAVYQTMRELHEASQGKAWHVIAVLDTDDIVSLFGELAPRYGTGVKSLSLECGGVCIECGEIDMIAPATGMPRPVGDAVARGRHYRLSLLFATQRPHQCARLLSSQADELFSFAMHEPRDLAFLASACGNPFADTVRRLQKYHYAHFNAETGAITTFTPDGKRSRVILADQQRELL